MIVKWVVCRRVVRRLSRRAQAMPPRRPTRTRVPAPGLVEYQVSSQRVTVDERYEITRCVGGAVDGVLCSGVDTASGEHVGIRKITHACDGYRSDTMKLLREVKMLSFFMHDNVHALRDIMMHEDIGEREEEEHDRSSPCGGTDNAAFRPTRVDVYLVTDHYESDLCRVIRSQQPLTDGHCQYFLFQILRALRYIHSAGVMHRDVKPANFLVNQECDLVLTDFAMAHGVGTIDTDSDRGLDSYVCVRWYRAPELLLLSLNDYTSKIDVFAAGCVFAELYHRRPIFPGRDHLDQLKRIITAFGGVPHDYHDQWARGGMRLNPAARKYLDQFTAPPEAPPVDLSTLVPSAPAAAVRILTRMLAMNPSERVSADAALEDPYFADLRAAVDAPEPPCHKEWRWRRDGADLTAAEACEEFRQEMLKLAPWRAEESTKPDVT